jgi:hypothetical protein
LKVNHSYFDMGSFWKCLSNRELMLLAVQQTLAFSENSDQSGLILTAFCGRLTVVTYVVPREVVHLQSTVACSIAHETFAGEGGIPIKTLVPDSTRETEEVR